MKYLILLKLLFAVSLFAIDVSFLKVEKIVLESGETFTDKNYNKATGKGYIYYLDIATAPFEYDVKSGEFKFSNDDIDFGFLVNSSIQYYGDIKNGKKDGFGKLGEIDYITYTGEWRNDKIHGNGLLIQDRSDFKYEGHFKNAKKDGQGDINYSLSVYFNKDKTKYSLEYDKDKFPDRVYYNLNYIGKFKEDKLLENSGNCFLINSEYGIKQNCTLKNSKVVSKIETSEKLLENNKKLLKDTKKPLVVNLLILDKNMKKINYLDKEDDNDIYVRADTNLKDETKVKVMIEFVYNNIIIYFEEKETIVKDSVILQKFNTKEILSRNSFKFETIQFSIEYDD